MKKRLLAAALICVLLSGCGTGAELPVLPETAEEERVTGGGGRNKLN